MQMFVKAKFLKRPNRFTVIALLDNKRVYAYLPNPGRLWELLTPETKLILEKISDSRSFRYKVLAIERDGHPILVDTHRTNYIVEKLLLEKRIPSFQAVESVRREVSFKNHRFDFLLKDKNKEHILEVKTCTLFENNIAMFPDAITSRGLSHIKLLEELRGKNFISHLVFVVMYDKARFFLPAYHVDIDFTKALLRFKDKINVKAISIKLKHNLFDVEKVSELTIPWEVINREADDCGAYMIIYELKDDRWIKIGEMGEIFFQKGYYIYAGSSRSGLEKRIARHKRKIKKLHWHIDYLADKAYFKHGIPIRTKDDIECEIASELRKITNGEIRNFGSSDCNCPGHLFFMKEDPLSSIKFIKLLQHFRIARLNKKLN